MTCGRKTGAERAAVKPRRIETQTVKGKSLALACKQAEISEQKYYR